MPESIREATATWKDKEFRQAGGIYIVRSGLDGQHDKVRIGVGGVRGGAKGLYARLTNHSRDRIAAERWTYATHEFQPYSVVRAWYLIGWGPEQLEYSEMYLYRAFVTRFPRYRGVLPDKSLFVVPDDDLQNVIEEIDCDLRSIAKWRSNQP